MLAVPERRRPHPHALIGVAIYAVFLVTAPFEHHDLLCHLKTPTHCTACTSSVVGAGPNAPVAVDAAALHDAGRALAADVRTRDVLLVAQSTGRSPPAAA
jgi:hypothetical protein